jgi:5-methylcytosine-specific restriction endonuclease McrA
VVSPEFTLQDREEWLKDVTCPKCEDWCEPTGRSFRFGVFDGKTYLCESCGKHFNVFYRDGTFSHTVPRAQVELRESGREQVEETSDRTESTDVGSTVHDGEVHNIICPRCDSLSQPTGRTFKFGVFDGRSFKCEQCEKNFNAFYRADIFSHTVPGGRVEIIEESTVDTKATRRARAETPPIQEEPEPESMYVDENPELETSEDQTDDQEPGPDAQGEETEAQEASNTFVEQVISPSSASVGSDDAITDTQDEVVGFMKGLRKDVERIQVLTQEEEEVVGEFSRALFRATSPLSLALPVDASLLPLEIGDIERASIAPRGVLVLLMSDGTMETINLVDPENRDLLVTVVRHALPQYKTLLQVRRQKIEQRIAFLSKATRDLREIADYIESKES